LSRESRKKIDGKNGRHYGWYSLIDMGEEEIAVSGAGKRK
jgi:hypothetical protein